MTFTQAIDIALSTMEDEHHDIFNVANNSVCDHAIPKRCKCRYALAYRKLVSIRRELASGIRQSRFERVQALLRIEDDPGKASGKTRRGNNVRAKYGPRIVGKVLPGETVELITDNEIEPLRMSKSEPMHVSEESKMNNAYNLFMVWYKHKHKSLQRINDHEND